MFVLGCVFPAKEAFELAAILPTGLLNHLASLGMDEQPGIIDGVPLVIGIAGYILQLARGAFHIQAVYLPDGLYIVAGVLVSLIGFGFPAAAQGVRYTPG